MQDKEIVAEALQSPEALTRFLRKMEPFVYQTAYYLTGQKADAEDIAQESLWKVCRSLHQFNGQGSIRGWIHRVVVNTFREQIRKKKATLLELDEAIQSSEMSVEQQVEDKFAEERLYQAIANLPINYREVILLRHIHDLSYQEIADTLELTEAQVKTRLFRGREKLRGLLEGGGLA
ncbi:MAG TPA: sigma-70 family RNA polymerase sigma factor [Bacilli bacterium]|nr:sigma-70 family RNA polymerase sigma factor [Bacilli bacterium]